MLVRNKGMFFKGLFLMGTFLLVLFVVFTPVLKDEQGNPVTGLVYSDLLFNTLAKGSAYYIPNVTRDIAPLQGKTIDLTVKQKDADAATAAVKLLTLAGLTAEPKDTAVHVTGDLGKMLSVVVSASDKLYNNDSAAVSSMFGGMDGLKAMKAWWGVLNPMVKELQKQKKIDEADAVTTVNSKAIEPAYNFYGIKAEKVSDRVFVMSGLLIFYVVYTMWYGYAIYFMFNGIGLAMTKAKVKKEV